MCFVFFFFLCTRSIGTRIQLSPVNMTFFTVSVLLHVEKKKTPMRKLGNNKHAHKQDFFAYLLLKKFTAQLY